MDNITDMKWIHVFCRRGSEVDFVRSYSLTVSISGVLAKGILKRGYSP